MPLLEYRFDLTVSLNDANDVTTPALRIREVLTTVPHVTAQQWQGASAPVRWLLAVRAPTLTMTLGAVAIGGLLAAADGSVNLTILLLCAIGCGLAHATNNLLNDLTDFVRGVDDGNYFRLRYGTHVLAQGLVSRADYVRVLVITGLAAALIGVLVTYRVGAVLWVPFLAGAALLLLYTFPMKQWALGEFAVWLVWGPLLVGGTYIALTGTASWPMFAVASVAGLGPTLVIFGKHTDKLAWDAVRSIRTLPVRLGEHTSRMVMRGLVWGPHFGTVALVIAGVLRVPALLVLAALPQAIALDRVCRRPYPDQKPSTHPDRVWPLWFAAYAFIYARRFSLLLITGLAISLLMRRFE
jgi:1,4-dihydroxy-2-naphthoate polyprenyltransferase